MIKGDGLFILDEQGEPVFEPDWMKWADWFESNFFKRRVGRTQVGPYMVSTVFLGVDHNCGEGPPLLWETLIFCEAKDACGLEDQMDRCSGSREQAEAMHVVMVEKLEAMLALNV